MAAPKWRDYAAAEEWARSLGLKNQAAWQKLPKTTLPADIPKDPWKVYGKEFRGWGAWLGTLTIANRDKGPEMSGYEQAKMFSRNLGLKNQSEWQEYARSNKRPDNIPNDPYTFYKSEWESWGTWLGTDYVAHRYHVHRPFAEARAYARTLGLGARVEWEVHWRHHKRPVDIPADPQAVYRGEFRGWRDFLGSSRRLTRMAVAAIIDDLIPILPYLDESELYTILQESGLLAQLGLMEDVSPLVMLRSILRGDLPDLRKRIQNSSENQRSENHSEAVVSDAEREGGPGTEGDNQTVALSNVANIASEDGLGAVDRLAASGLALPEDVIENLVQNRVAAMWDCYFDAPDNVQILIENQEGYYYCEIVRRFQEQLDEVINLPIPSGWSFSRGEVPVLPNAMQRRTAILVRDHRRMMNLSTAGAGKTAAAILSAGVIGAEVTVVVTNLSTIDGWRKEINRTFPDALVFTDVEECAEAISASGRYLLVNYDKFQGLNRDIVMKIAELRPDFLVLDEMHFVKQRSRDPSQRRVAVEEMVEILPANNPDLHLLGMSATAAINNLREPKKLLELVTGRDFPNLKTEVTVDNAMAMHQAITSHGFRFRYRSKQELREETVRTVRNDLLPRLINMDGGVLEVERLLLTARLDAVRSRLCQRTIIYTHYIDGMVEPIKKYLAGLGLTAGVYTGSEKTGIDAFVAEEVDVLIGSAPVAVGLNGLQHVSNRLVVVSLPWTHAQYEQLVGRIHRQGSPFAFVEVLIPMVVAEVNGHEWSWDQERMRLLNTKRTLSDCVLDGLIPESSRMSHEDLLRQSRETLNRWVKEVVQAETTLPDTNVK